MSAPDVDSLVATYIKQRKAYSGFLNNVVDFFRPDNENLHNESQKFSVHSVKFREKDLVHLKEKISRKISEGREINETNLFQIITDFCGVRVLHLRQSDFSTIHNAITNHVKEQHWCFFENPKAYTWDPESKIFFESLGLGTEIKESSYTSVHYVVKPNPDIFVTCEIQVRSLFEEVRGEIDHDLNYPTPTDNIACREQLKVLAKIVGAGTRLVDSIYNSIGRR